MKRIILFMILILSVSIVYAQVQTVVNVHGLGLYQDDCVNDSGCVSGLCIYDKCACVDDGDCVYGGSCIGNQCLLSDLWTNSELYTPGASAKIYGDRFTANNLVEIEIKNATGDLVYGPVNVSTNSSGEFFTRWNTTGLDFGNYTIFAHDLTESLYDQWEKVKLLGPYTWTGRIFDAFNNTVASNMTVTDDLGGVWHIDDTNYNVTLYYGVEYDVNITIGIDHPIKNFVFRFVLNEGFEGDILGIDNTPLNNSDFTEWKQIVGYYPIIDSFQNVRIFFSHPVTDFADKLYKCTDWNFFSRRCNNDSSWELLQDYVSGESNTEIVMYPGDPGLGIGKDADIFCGNGVCDFDESCSSCSADCGGCGSPSRPTGCRYNWNCTGWGICEPEGFRYRECVNTGTCTDRYRPPVLEEECEYDPNCKDGVQNNQETDVDCGGNCVRCDLDMVCERDNDCKSGYCFMDVCRKASCSDGIKNQGEEGVDCGGPCGMCPESRATWNMFKELPGTVSEGVCTFGSATSSFFRNNGFTLFYLILVFLVLTGMLIYLLRKEGIVYAVRVRPDDYKATVLQLIKRKKGLDKHVGVFSSAKIRDVVFVEAYSKKDVLDLVRGVEGVTKIANNTVSAKKFINGFESFKDGKVSKEEFLSIFY